MMSLQQRLFTYITGLTLLVLLGMGVASTGVMRYTTQQHLIDRLGMSTRGTMDEVAEMRTELMSNTSSIASQNMVRAAFASDDRGTLLTYFEQAYGVLALDQVDAIDRDGNIMVAAERPVGPSSEQLERTLLERSVESNGVSQIARRNAGVTVEAVHPVYEAGELMGFVLLRRNLGHGFAERISRRYEVGAVVYDGERLQAVSLPEPGTVASPVLARLRDHVRQTGSGIVEEAHLGATRHLIAAEPLISAENELRGVLLLTLPSERMHRSVLLLTLLFALVALCMLAVGMVVAYRFTFGIVRPLRTLGGATRELSQGDFAVRAEVTREDEVGDLAKSFNAMAERLEQTTTSVAVLNKEVEVRRNAEKALRESEETARILLNGPADMAVVVSPDGRILDVNDTLQERLGDSRDALIGTCLWDHYTEDTAETWRERLAEVLESKQPLRGEYEVDERWLDVIIHPVIDSGEVTKVAITARDFTEHKELEVQLRHAQRMEAVGQLAGGVAHDFNNLLQAILGYGDLAKQNAPADSQLKRDITESMKAAQSASTLVRQLLAFSRQQVLHLKDIDLNEVVDETASMIRRIIGEHIKLAVNTTPGLKVIQADSGQIQQVIMNLCVNARDAMPKGGELVLETGQVEFDAVYCAEHAWANEGSYVCLSVTDTGSGINTEIRDKIFEPFFTTKEMGRGTGLGLASVYGVVRQHDGMVHVYSEPGEGTRFRVYFPCADSPDPEDLESFLPPTPPPTGNETVLVAEDDEALRALAKRVLVGAGYTVLTAVDGEEAVRVFDEHAEEVDVALLDVVMPNMGGKAVLKHIYVSRPGLPVLFASGYSVNSVHTEFVLDDGMNLIQKPYSPIDLLHRIRAVIDEAS